ncbi:MAG: hypothetical protein GY850_39470 [bacterium]|nr:hypothetical protein [bacterium]
MELNKSIIVLACLLCLMSALTNPDRSIATTEKPAGQTQKLYLFGFKHQSIFVAQNNSQATDDETRKTNEKEDQASKSGTAKTENNKNKSKDSAPKPLKPFKPSEKIAAEQAVDFPVDI